METSWAGSGLLGDVMPFTRICSWFVTAERVDDRIAKKFLRWRERVDDIDDAFTFRR